MTRDKLHNNKDASEAVLSKGMIDDCIGVGASLDLPKLSLFLLEGCGEKGSKYFNLSTYKPNVPFVLSMSCCVKNSVVTVCQICLAHGYMFQHTFAVHVVKCAD